MSASSAITLLDAEAVIDVFRIGLGEALLGEPARPVPRLAIARAAAAEVHYFRDAAGSPVPIDLRSFVESGKLQVLDADAADLQEVLDRGRGVSERARSSPSPSSS